MKMRAESQSIYNEKHTEPSQACTGPCEQKHTKNDNANNAKQALLKCDAFLFTILCVQ